MKQYLKEAFKINELEHDLENISQDDKRPMESYTVAEVVHEARHVLGLFLEGGTFSNEELESDAPEIRRPAQRQVRMLRKFISKWEEGGVRCPR